MKPYVFLITRNVSDGNWESSTNLPQFQVHASSPEEALAKGRAILGADTMNRAHHGAMTDGDFVWDLVTGRRI